MSTLASNQSYNSSTRSVQCQRRLFVSGFPSKIDPSIVEKYFSQFGRVRIIRLKNCVYPFGSSIESNNFKGDIKRGFCILEPENEKVLEDIISRCNGASFYGRILGVGIFRSGAELADYNTEFKKRRVIVKKVPASIDLSALKSVLETKFGKIIRMYGYQPESPSKTTRRFGRIGKSQSFSVEFEMPETALNAYTKGTLKIGNEEIKIEKYCRNTIIPAKESKIQNSLTSSSSIDSESYNILPTSTTYHKLRIWQPCNSTSELRFNISASPAAHSSQCRMNRRQLSSLRMPPAF